MPRGNRVDWTEFELDSLFTAVKDLRAKDRGLAMVKAMQLAQVVLPENRRRTISAISNIPEPLRQRFIVNALLAKDWEKQGRRRKRSEEPEEEEDPRNARIVQLMEEAGALRQELHEAQAKLAELEKRPSTIEIIQSFIADTLGMALVKSRELPGGPRPIPSYMQRPPQAARHNPQPQEVARQMDKPALVLVGVEDNQRERFNEKFRPRASVRFWREGGDTPVGTLKDMVRRANFTFVRADVTTQATLAMIRDVMGDKFQRVPGSDARLFEEVESYLRRREQQAP